MERRIRVEEPAPRLDQFLVERAGLGVSRSRVRQWILDGHVAVNGERAAKAGLRLEPGDLIAVDVPAASTNRLRPEAIRLEIVYEDEAVLVVNKPRGMVVHPSPGHEQGTLVHALLGLGGPLAAGSEGTRPGIVHRLDRDTTGLLIVARNERALASLQEQIRKRSLGREYLALVRGQPPVDSGTIDKPIGRHPQHRQRMAVEPTRGRPAVTHFTVIERISGPRGGYALLRCRLESGRTHQIRVHLASIGLPVAGDPTYGGRRGELGLTGQALHAARLSFDHPDNGARIVCQAPPPEDFQAALEAARSGRLEPEA